MKALRHAALKSVARPGVARRGVERDRKNRFPGGLPARPNATIRSPVAASMEHGRQVANTARQASNALIFRLFCSLRLSVRTPPFHGGESGSIPLGSAIKFPTLSKPKATSESAPRAWCSVDMKTDLSRQHETRLVRGNIPRSFDVSDEELRDDAGKVRRSACARHGKWAHAKSKAAGFFPVAEPRQR